MFQIVHNRVRKKKNELTSSERTIPSLPIPSGREELGKQRSINPASFPIPFGTPRRVECVRSADAGSPGQKRVITLELEPEPRNWRRVIRAKTRKKEWLGVALIASTSHAAARARI